MRPRTYLNLNALRIRSTSISRWKAEASRLSNFSISTSSVFAGVDEEAAGVDEGLLDMVNDSNLLPVTRGGNLMLPEDRDATIVVKIYTEMSASCSPRVMVKPPMVAVG